MGNVPVFGQRAQAHIKNQSTHQQGIDDMRVEKDMNNSVDRPMVRAGGSPLGPYMAEGCAQNELKIQKADQHPAMAQQWPGLVPGNLLRRFFQPTPARSEERRVGQECRYRW